MSGRVSLVSWPAAVALAEANPLARVLVTGSGMNVTLPDATYVAIRPNRT